MAHLGNFIPSPPKPDAPEGASGEPQGEEVVTLPCQNEMHPYFIQHVAICRRYTIKCMISVISTIYIHIDVSLDRA